MCARTGARILSSERVFREWSQNPCKLQGKNPLYRRLKFGFDDGFVGFVADGVRLGMGFEAMFDVRNIEWVWNFR